MAKARKLQQEVEATLKRVQEGCDEWDTLWDKLEDTEVGRGEGLAGWVRRAGGLRRGAQLERPPASVSAVPCARTHAPLRQRSYAPLRQRSYAPAH